MRERLRGSGVQQFERQGCWLLLPIPGTWIPVEIEAYIRDAQPILILSRTLQLANTSMGLEADEDSTATTRQSS